MISIQQASADDIDDVMNVMRYAFDPLHGEAWTRAQCLSALIMPGSNLLIARGETVAGFALTRSIVDEAELLLLAVMPEQRRSGIGRFLLEQVCAQARANGVKTLFLEVRDTNAARDFYARMGFREVGFRKNYYRGMDGEFTDAVTATKIIA